MTAGRAFAVLAALIAAGSAGGQQGPIISGRIVSATGVPLANVSLTLHDQPCCRTSLGADRETKTNATGRFQFAPMRAGEYILTLRAAGVRMDPKPIDARNGRNINIGEWRLEACQPMAPRTMRSLSKSPALKPEQIIVEPKVLAENSSPIKEKAKRALEPCCCPGKVIESPADPAIFDMDTYSEYTFAFKPDISIARFYGAKVKAIRVTRFHYQFWQGGAVSLAEIRAQVLKVWNGTFSYASPQINWAEGNEWNIEASVEYEDGTNRSLVTDGSHVEVQSQDGRHWLLRLRPAA